MIFDHLIRNTAQPHNWAAIGQMKASNAMIAVDPKFELRLAQCDADMRASQRLRYEVFVKELGGDGELVDHNAEIERDAFDDACDHLILFDKTRYGTDENAAVGVYRLRRSEDMAESDTFYTEGEYDLSVLRNSGRSLLELGRSCVAADYRGGNAMYFLWQGLSDYVARHDIEILFGVASFHGICIPSLAERLSLLHHRSLAPTDLRVRAQPGAYQDMNLVPEVEINRARAMRETPALIKAYLRLGGFVGDGAFVDHDFNTTDVCLIMDTSRMTEAQRNRYDRGQRA